MGRASEDDVKALIDLLRDWASRTSSELQMSGCYLFGSLVYKNGQQFGGTSDIDLVVVMPEMASIIERWRWLQALAQHKDALEYKLLRSLHRKGDEPIASLVPLTSEEVHIDIHKDGHREFYRSNIFMDLLHGSLHEGLAGAGTKAATRYVVGALSSIQKVRNEYMGTSANGTAVLTNYSGADPIPKRIMRAASMAAKERDTSLGPGAEYDVQEGLDLISTELYQARDADAALRALQNIVSIRRSARGDEGR